VSWSVWEGCDSVKYYQALIVSGALAVLFIAAGIPLMLRKVKRNHWYGFRLNRYVLSDDDIWFEVNAMGGRNVICLGVVLAVVAVVSAFFTNSKGAQTALLIVSMAVALSGIAYSLWATTRLSYRLADEKGLRNA